MAAAKTPRVPRSRKAPGLVVDTSAAAQWATLEEVQRWAKNPRNIPRAKVEEAKASLVRFGFCAPCVGWAAERRLVVGHARTLGLLELLSTTPDLAGDDLATLRASLTGPTLRHVPIRFRDFASEGEADAYAIRDNRAIGSWNDEGLGDLLRSLEAGGTPTEGLGFGPAELLAMGLGDPDAHKPDETPPPRLDKRTACAKCGYDGGPLP